MLDEVSKNRAHALGITEPGHKAKHKGDSLVKQQWLKRGGGEVNVMGALH